MKQLAGKIEVVRHAVRQTPGGLVIEDHGLRQCDRGRMAARVELPHLFGDHWQYRRKRKPKKRFADCALCGKPTRGKICHSCQLRRVPK